MSYHIKKGTRVRIRAPKAESTDWRQHRMRIDLRFLEPLSSDRGAYVFEHQGWRIRARKNDVDHIKDAKSA